MSRFVLCACCALVGAPCLADPIVITEGPLPPLIEEPSIIVSGEYAGSLKSMATLEISGGHFTSEPAMYFGLKRLTAPTFIIHARYARAIDASKLSEGTNPGDVQIQGFLDDGQFFRFFSRNEDDAPGFTLLHITPTNDPLPFMPDADGDTDLDIEDLNAVRNNFGGTGSGDIDGNGLVDIGDLNYVRNNFGQVQFTIDESHTSPVGWSQAAFPDRPLPGVIPTPEPSTLVLAALGVMALCSKLRWGGSRTSDRCPPPA